MVPIISDFLSISGLDALPPTNLAELIPYLLNVFVGVVLITAVFRVIGGIARALVDLRRM